jgi:histidine ammonia-lyase
MISIAQAMDLSENFDKFSSAAKELYNFVREEVAVIEQDRPLSDDLTRLKNKVLITKKELL